MPFFHTDSYCGILEGMAEKINLIVEVCDALKIGMTDVVIRLLKRGYPFVSRTPEPRKYGPRDSTRVFIRDGFVDRYSGERLIFLPVLRIISRELPDDFPYHPHWKTTVTHPAFWEAGATVDHLEPVCREGPDDDSNWFTTSMARNSAKGNWTLAQLGWSLQPPGEFKDWDGLIQWFLEYTGDHPGLLDDPWMGKWHSAAVAEVPKRGPRP